MIAAALYIRLSREDDRDGPSESISNQRSLLEQFAAGQGFPIHDVYIDDGWSGTSFDRPAFRRLLQDIEAGTVNLVITKDLSRLGRDYILTGHYLERYFPEHGVRYISLLDGVDTGTDTIGNEMTPFRAILNDLYAKDISKKIKSVKHDKQRRGLFIGGKALYGYRLDPAEKNRLLPDPPAAAVVRRIFSMAAAGQSCRAIAALLNEEQLPSPAAYASLPRGSGRWSGERISEMLQNETYLGNLVQGRMRKVSYKSKKRIRLPRSQWIVAPGTHEPLVDRETFDAARRSLESRRHTRCRTYAPLLKGLLFCRECGHSLGVINRKTADGQDRLYYICRTHQRSPALCSPHTIKEEVVNQAVFRAVEALCKPFLRQELLQPEALALIQRLQPDRQQQDALQNQLQQQNRLLDRLYLDRASGLLPEEDFSRLYQSARNAKDALLQESAPASSVSPGEQAAALTEAFCADACGSRALLTALVERIELTEDRQLLMHFRCSAPNDGCLSPRNGREP